MIRTRLGAALAVVVLSTMALAGFAEARPTSTAVSPTGPAGISGTITDQAGHPLTGVHVIASSWSGLAGGGFAKTDAGGHFSVPTGPGDFYLNIAAGRATGGMSDRTGYYDPAPWRRIIRVRVATMHSGVRIRLHPAGLIVGHVTDVRGHPLTGVRPYLRPVIEYATGWSFSDPDQTNAPRRTGRGWFRITGVTPGAYQVCFHAGYLPVVGGATDRMGYQGTCRPGAVSVASGSRTRAGTVGLTTLSGGAIAGRVVGYDHTPLRDVQVVVHLGRYIAETTTDFDGRYWARGLPAGSHRVCFMTEGIAGPSPTGYAPRCLADAVSVQPHRVRRLATTLSAGAAVHGVITGAHGSPLSGAFMEAFRGNAYIGPDAGTGDAGRYRFRNLAPGRWDVCAGTDFSTAAGLDDPTGGVPECVADTGSEVGLTAATTTDVDLKLKAAGGIRGTVRDRQGRPIAGVEVDFEGPDQYGNEGEFYAVTDSRGRYQGVDLPPAANYWVCFSDVYFWEKCDKHITVKGGTFLDGIDATLPRTTPPSTEVIVTDIQGHRLAGVNAVLFKKCAPSAKNCEREPLLGARASIHQSDVTDARGHVTLMPYRTGTYSLCLFAYYGAAAGRSNATGYSDMCLDAPVTIPTRGTGRTVHVRLSRAGAVSGRVTGSDGRPLAHVRVSVSGSAVSHLSAGARSLYSDMSPVFDAFTDSRGQFFIRGVTPGTRLVVGAGRVVVRARQITRGVHVSLNRAKQSAVFLDGVPAAQAATRAARTDSPAGRANWWPDGCPSTSPRIRGTAAGTDWTCRSSSSVRRWDGTSLRRTCRTCGPR
ncbi:MAG TPA: carboxypeptidase-like regulatory domain-containing protein [Jatrophihabitans sp.]|jgi:protocatechuate 3,4-dioxygenase beta subunit